MIGALHRTQSSPSTTEPNLAFFVLCSCSLQLVELVFFSLLSISAFVFIMVNNKLMLTAASSVLLIMLANKLRRKESKRKRSVWSKEWIQRRDGPEGPGILKILNEEIRIEDPQHYRNILRMTDQQFTYLLSLVEKSIGRQDTNMRQAISACHRLQVTLRFLATGESYKSLMLSTRIHSTTISIFVPEVCKAIYVALKDKHLQMPNTAKQWEQIANEFMELWQFPNCLGALDGRHITFRAPLKDGAYYYNYKGTHSIVLLALADAKYRFTYVNVGVNGRVSDGGVFNQCGLAQALNENSLNLPRARCLLSNGIEVPYVIIADDAFSLSTKLLKPYAKYVDHDRKIFNYRLSRARRMVESAFGILANRFRVLLHPMNLSADKVESITLACVALHNFLIDESNTQYTSVDEGNELAELPKINKVSNNRKPTTTALKIRDEFKAYFVSEGKVDWQENAILNHNM